MQESRGAFGVASFHQDGTKSALLVPCGAVGSSLLWHLGCLRCFLLRALLDAEAPRSSYGGEFLGFLSKYRSLRSSWLCWWRQKAQWGTKERFRKEKANKRDRKASLQEKNTFPVIGAASGWQGAEEGREVLPGG